MLDRLARHFYERLGVRYRLLFLATQGPAAMAVALATVALIGSYYTPPLDELALVAAIGVLFTGLAVLLAALRSQGYLVQVIAWRQEPDPSSAQTIAAWDAATNFPMRAFRRNALTINVVAIVPSTVAVVAVLGLPWWATPVIAVACLAPATYATILNYAIAEMLMRPAIEQIARALPNDFPFARHGLPVRKRFLLSLPALTGVTGMVVGALVTDRGGTGVLALTVATSLGVGLVLSLEVAALLSRAISDPIGRVRLAMARVRGGDYAFRLPPESSDELGQLFHDFNQMAAGLEEREQLREAFGTYLDKDIVRFILSDRYPREGVEIDVSILFCDVRDFTAFAERSAAPAVVAALNELFETVVPIVSRHGGHVDKFLGDGMLAVFGAPEFFPDHADRAVAAACEIVRTVNGAGGALRLGAGVNSGRVVAGSIGGAGRLNFSVIGDAVNVAARVESATRQTGDDVLVTAATRDALQRPLRLTSRGTVALKGKSRPVEVLTPLPPGPAGEGRIAGSGAREPDGLPVES
ncbi:adenylate/guanylate cyclase domain-containing protein [Patulibacter defluvii]|uniref:adenylate/guanylate cyclase domain-containing protein n=1 Tax=Patulibacter defluvii TaxID=3095358 RepID=UPI002A7591BD|nr:adenylate/guanylate cyclase domain-containing protein [Patulibacter sp. DM4]